MSRVYNDTLFGGISWSADETQIAFIGEVPEVTNFKNPFDGPSVSQPATEEESKTAKPDEHWQEDKFLYSGDFGEGLVGKKQPAIFVFNLINNSLNRLLGIPEKVVPSRPIFDEQRGIVFAGTELPLKKLGIVACLNRPTKVYYIAQPIFDKEFQLPSDYLKQVSSVCEYSAMHPKFSHDFTSLVYVCSDSETFSHSGNNQLKQLTWPLDGSAPKLVIDRVADCPDDKDQFGGLYGY